MMGLKKERKEAKLSQKEAARMVGIATVTLQSWERKPQKAEKCPEIKEKLHQIYQEYAEKHRNWPGKLYETRLKYGLTQMEAARILQVNYKTYQGWEKGTVTPRERPKIDEIDAAFRTTDPRDVPISNTYPQGVHYTQALPPEQHAMAELFLRSLSEAAKDAHRAGKKPDVGKFIEAFRENYADLRQEEAI